MWAVIWPGDSHFMMGVKVSPPRITLFPLISVRDSRDSHSLTMIYNSWDTNQSNHRHTLSAERSTSECHLNILWFWSLFPGQAKPRLITCHTSSRNHKHFPLFLHFSDLTDIMKTNQLTSKHWFLFSNMHY